MRSILPSMLLFAACANEPAPQIPGTLDVGTDVLMTVNGQPLTEKMIDVAVGAAPTEVQERLKSSPQEKQQLLDNMALTEVLYRKALESKLHEQQHIKDAMALTQREILSSYQMNALVDAKVTDEAVKERFQSLQAQLNKPMADVDHILVKQQDLAVQLVTDINAGKIDFLAAAKQHSVERGVEQHGGDLGWQMRPPIMELQDAWENAPTGEVVGPVEGRLGFHILRVNERRVGVPLEEARPRIEEMLRREALNTIRTDLMAEAEIVNKMNEAAAPAGDEKPGSTP